MMSVLWSIFGFVLAIGILVTFHEFGHYWVARRCGVKVLRFSIGFGRPLWSRVSADGVEFVLAAIPLGGYVRMLDERESDQPVPEALKPQAFNRQRLAKRVAIVAAGPVFNFLLAVLLYAAIHWLGVPDMRPVLAEPAPSSALAEAGVDEGTELVAVNGTPTPTWTRARLALLDHALAGGALELSLRSEDGPHSVRIDLAGMPVEPEPLFRQLGLALYRPAIAPRLAEVIPGEAADAAGLQAGDLLLARNGQPIESWSQWARWVREHPGEVAQLRVERDGAVIERDVVIGSLPGSEGASSGRFGAAVVVPEGLYDELRTVYREGPLQAVWTGVEQTATMSWLTLRMLGRMIVGDVSVKNISGPLQIAEYAGYTAAAGLVSYLGFLALISVSLGVLNLLPIPMLDGGHLLYYAVEAVKGSPVSERTQVIGQQLGLLMLAGLMGLAFYNDLSRLFG